MQRSRRDGRGRDPASGEPGNGRTHDQSRVRRVAEIRSGSRRHSREVAVGVPVAPASGVQVTEKSRRWIWAIVAIAVATRLLAMVYFRAYDLPATEDHFPF